MIGFTILFFATGQSALIVIRRIAVGMLLVTSSGGEELFEGHRACRFLVLPLSFSDGVGHQRV